MLVMGLLLLVFPVALLAQNTITITGRVLDDFNEPAVGVSVMVKNAKTAAFTDVDGTYSIKAAPNAVLVFSFLGLTTKEEAVNGRTKIDVIMSQDAQQLSEVVVVGYGQMKRSDLTGSVVSVSSDAIAQSIPTSIDQVLQGRAAGVQVTQNSGIPGGSSSIRIRGVNSLNSSNEPIFVIDGVVIDGATGSNSINALSSINPSDIVSMDVLKDASATAIYGSRGANGVIIITTKRGEKGDARINYDGFLGVQMMPKKLDMLNLQQYAYHKNERTKIMGHPMDDNFVRPDLLGDGTDWQDELFNPAFMQSHNLSISGGTDKVVYAMSAGYLDQDGIALGSGFKRLNLRGSIEADLKKWLKAGANFALGNTKQIITVADNDLINMALQQTPNVAARNPDGSYGGPDTDEFVQSNPVGLAQLKENTAEISDIRSGIYLDFKFMEGLNLRTEFSSDISMNNTYKFTPTYTFGAIHNDVRESTRTKSYNVYWSWRNVLTYNKTFAEKHTINAMLGQEMQDSRWEYLMGTRTGFLTNNAKDLDAGDATTAQNAGNSGESSLLSFFGRAFYSFDDRYLLTATLRYDGSSKFDKSNQWGLFPSAAVAWKISNESFFKETEALNFMNNFKFRAGWGIVGNQNIPNYAYTSVMSSVPTIWGTGMLSGNTANPDVQWEKTTSVNLGVDMNFFNNRIEVIFDWYNKQTDNLLLQVPLPAYVGSSGQGSTTPPWVNVGSLQNRGVEFTLNTLNIDKGGFTWRSNIVISSNRNKVLSLQTASAALDKTLSKGSETTIVTRTQVGQPIGQFYGYEVIGRFNSATDMYYKDADGSVKKVAMPEGIPVSETGVWVGDLMFRDVNGDGVINDADRTFIGNPEPKFTFGFGNTFSYKGFDLTVYLNGSYGNKVFNWMQRWTEDPRQSTNITMHARDYAKLGVIDPAASGTDYRNLQVIGGAWDMPRLSPADANKNQRVSDRYIEDGSYLRIQNISLGYTFPAEWTRKIYIENLKVYANIQNLYTFTNYEGYDPELGSIGQDALLSGIDNGRYPSPRVFTFGLNITF